MKILEKKREDFNKKMESGLENDNDDEEAKRKIKKEEEFKRKVSM